MTQAAPPSEIDSVRLELAAAQREHADALQNANGAVDAHATKAAVRVLVGLVEKIQVRVNTLMRKLRVLSPPS